MKVLSPTSDSPAWGSGSRKNPQRIWLCRSAGFDCRNSTMGWGKETPLLEGAHTVLWVPEYREKSSDIISIRRSLAKVGGSCDSLWQKRLITAVLGTLIGVSPPGGHHFLTKIWPHPTGCWLQRWDASGQTTNRAGTQSHP